MDEQKKFVLQSPEEPMEGSGGQVAERKEQSATKEQHQDPGNAAATQTPSW